MPETAETGNSTIVRKTLFRLLPAQILLAASAAVTGIISSLFAGNYIGPDAMTAVGLYGPVNMLIGAVTLMMVGGSQILCGQYMGKNQLEQTQAVFSLDLIVTAGLAVIFTVGLLAAGFFDLTRFICADAAARSYLNPYVIGQAAGVFPLMLSQQLAAFLSLENRNGRTAVGFAVQIAASLGLHYLLIAVMRIGTLGLALSVSLSTWLLLFVQAQYFLSGRSMMKFRRKMRLHDALDIFKVGAAGSLSTCGQAQRGVILNGLILKFVGSAGLSAFATVNTLLAVFWAIPGGMIAVSRMLMSVAAGEEDRETLVAVMKNMILRFVPLMAVVSAGLVLSAVPLTRLYYRDVSAPVYQLTVQGFRMLPICMPLSVIFMHFVGLNQIFGKQVPVHLLSLLDGVVFVAGFSALLIPFMGMKGVYAANILNGICLLPVIFGIAWVRRHRIPKTPEEVLDLPDSFGTADGDRLDLSAVSMEEVVSVSRQVEAFCRSRGFDQKKSSLAGLAMEEMAGNVVEHGFHMDHRKHAVNMRVVRKDNDLILRIRDDCRPFDPEERSRIVDPEDITKNIGIRMIYGLARKITYQNLLGLNVLTIRL